MGHALCVMDALIRAWCWILFIWSLQPPHEPGTIIADTLKKRKLKHKEAKELAWITHRRSGRGGIMNPVDQAPEPLLSFLSLLLSIF